MHVFRHFYVWVHTCVCRSPRLTCNIFSRFSPPYILRQGLWLIPELAFLASLASCLHLRFSCPFSLYFYFFNCLFFSHYTSLLQFPSLHSAQFTFTSSFIPDPLLSFSSEKSRHLGLLAKHSITSYSKTRLCTNPYIKIG